MGVIRKKGENMEKQNRNIISTQVRLPADIYEYIEQEAERMGIAKNAFLIILLEQGRKLWKADFTVQLKEE